MAAAASALAAAAVVVPCLHGVSAEPSKRSSTASFLLAVVWFAMQSFCRMSRTLLRSGGGEGRAKLLEWIWTGCAWLVGEQCLAQYTWCA